jgi:hypothetical protein
MDATRYTAQVRDRIVLTGVGAGAGLAAGLSWWLLWGCRACAAGSQPWSQLAFSALVGVVLANAWGMDHLRNRRGYR